MWATTTMGTDKPDERVLAAVLALRKPNGARKQDIARKVEKDGGGAKLAPAALTKALQKLVTAARLAVVEGNRYTVPGVTFEPPKDETVVVERLVEGAGPGAKNGDEITMSYVGTLRDGGAEFDRATTFKFTLGEGEVIKGWDKALLGVPVGARVRLTIPPKLGYGKRGSPPEIPPDAWLVFDCTRKK